MGHIGDLIKAHPAIVFGGVAVLLLIVALTRKGSTSASGDIPANEAALQAASIGGNTQIALASIDSQKSLNQIGGALELARIQAPAELEIAKAQIASSDSQNSANLAAMVTMATISANTTRAGIDAGSAASTQSLFASLLAPFAVAGAANLLPAAGA